MTTRTPRARRGPGRPSKPIARGRLLAIARATFAAKGYAGASMRDIAQEAGLTKASLFHHFPSKEKLYLEALASILGELEGLIRAAQQAQGPFAERLDVLGDLVVDYVGGHPEAARLLTRELLGSGPFMERGGSAIIQTTLKTIDGFLRGGMAEGAAVEQDAKQLALSIAGLHLYLFAAPEVSGQFLGVDVFSEEHVAARKVAIKAQLRRLCGVV